MSDETKKPELDLDAQAILARRKKLLAAAAVSLAISCEVRQEPAKTNINEPYTPPFEQPQYCLSVYVEPPKSEPASQTQPAETLPTVVTPPTIVRPPCLKPPPTICLKKRKCLSYKKPKTIICLSEF